MLPILKQQKLTCCDAFSIGYRFVKNKIAQRQIRINKLANEMAHGDIFG